MSYEQITDEQANKLPEPQRSYVLLVKQLGTRLLDVINDAGAPPSVVLDALLNCYVTCGTHYGRSLECANHMVQIGGQMVLADAMQKQASGQEPFPADTPPSFH